MRPDANIDHGDDTAAVIRHDARDLPFDDGTVDLIVTSPPYFALRSYRDDDGHYDGQIGSEATPDEFLDALDECMVEWRRVLKPSGSVWLNLGDKYAGSGGHNNSGVGADPERGPSAYEKASGQARPKSLMGLPWRFAIRQIDAGWILRAEVCWSKPNGLPESVTDRVRRSHEQWFHFVKEPRYFAAVDEIREPHTDRLGTDRFGDTGTRGGYGGLTKWEQSEDEGVHKFAQRNREYNPLGRVPGSVWTIPTEPLLIPDTVRTEFDLPDHFAAFPQEWPRRIVQGWSPSGVCVVCGEGRRPVVDSSLEGDPAAGGGKWHQTDDGGGALASRQSLASRQTLAATILGYECACPPVGDPPPTTPAVVVDPFGGTGTVAGVARMLGRYGVSNDLSAAYNRLAVWRIWTSGHFTKTEQRKWAGRQGTML